MYICLIWIYHHHFELWTLIPPGGWLFFLFFLALIGGVLSFDFQLLKSCRLYTSTQINLVMDLQRYMQGNEYEVLPSNIGLQDAASAGAIDRDVYKRQGCACQCNRFSSGG